jgi:hypothetical protein
MFFVLLCIAADLVLLLIYLRRRRGGQISGPLDCLFVFRYDQLAWQVYLRLTGQPWFNPFVLVNVVLVGAATGSAGRGWGVMKNTSFTLLFAWPRHRVDLETNRGENNPAIATALNVVGAFTTIVFTVEVLAKLIAESWHPERYFTAPEVSVLLRKSLGGEKVERGSCACAPVFVRWALSIALISRLLSGATP